jgi:polysaccharide pyruvyl transferase WcaK-like protein
MKRIAILGTPASSGNRGVLALGSSLVNLCHAAAPQAEIRFLLGHRKRETIRIKVPDGEIAVEIVPSRLSPKSALRDHLAWIVAMALVYRLLPIRALRERIARGTPWIGAVAAADLIGDVRGGDSFSDIYGLTGFLISFLKVWTVVLVKHTLVQFPQTFGPFQRPLARRLARFLLRRSSTVIARDKRSQEVAQGLIGPSKAVLLCPDVAFSLHSELPDPIELDPPLSGATPGTIGVNVNGLMYNGGYTRDNMFGLKLDYAAFLPVMVTALLGESPGEIWLVPHTYAPEGDVESDPDASRRLRNALPSDLRARVRIIAREYDQHELKGIIGSFDFFVGSRMHSCIAALSQGVPCAAVAYSMKFAGVFETVGMESWVVDARETTSEQAVARVIELYRHRAGVHDVLLQRAGEARAQLTGVFRLLFENATTEPPLSPS